MLERLSVPSLEQARTEVQTWRLDYNRVRPHSALGNLTPEAYANRDGVRTHEIEVGAGSKIGGQVTDAKVIPTNGQFFSRCSPKKRLRVSETQSLGYPWRYPELKQKRPASWQAVNLTGCGDRILLLEVSTVQLRIRVK